MASTNITTKFNEEGETDMMFYKRPIGFHIIKCAMRPSDGCEVPSRHDHILLNAYATTWVQRHGPSKILYSDGETGFNNEDPIDALKRQGTELRIRAPGQHARTIDRRNGVLRHTMHLIEE